MSDPFAVDTKVLMSELRRAMELAEDGTNNAYALLFHTIADLVLKQTGVDPRERIVAESSR